MIILFSFVTASLTFHSNRTSSILSEAESEFNRESIIIQSPNLPVIFEGQEIELRFSNLEEVSESDDDFDEEETTLGPTFVESKSVVKVNPGAIDNWLPFSNLSLTFFNLGDILFYIFV